jgi:hypothetical protein
MQYTALQAVRQSIYLQASYAQKLLFLDQQAQRLASLQEATEARERLKEKLSEELVRTLKQVRQEHKVANEESERMAQDLADLRQKYRQASVHGTENLAGKHTQADLEDWLRKQSAEKARRHEATKHREQDLQILEQANKKLQPGQPATVEEVQHMEQTVCKALANLMLSAPPTASRATPKVSSPSGSAASSAGEKAASSEARCAP